MSTPVQMGLVRLAGRANDPEWHATVHLYTTARGRPKYTANIQVSVQRGGADSWDALRERIINVHGEFLLNLAATVFADDVYWKGGDTHNANRME